MKLALPPTLFGLRSNSLRANFLRGTVSRRPSCFSMRSTAWSGPSTTFACYAGRTAVLRPPIVRWQCWRIGYEVRDELQRQPDLFQLRGAVAKSAWRRSQFERAIVMRAVAVRSPEGMPSDGLDQLASSDRLMTAKEVARLLAISEKTIYSYVSKGLIPYYKIQSSVRFRARDVNAWLSRQLYQAR